MVRRATKDGPAAVVKQLLEALVDGVEITPNREAVPFFSRSPAGPRFVWGHVKQVELEGIEPSSARC